MTEVVEKPDIMLLSTGVDAFIRTDLELLQKHFRVASVLWKGSYSLLRTARGIGRARLVFSWFAGDHSAVAALLACVRGRPSVLVSGGGDVAAMPEIGYGAMSRGIRWRTPAKIALGFSSLVLAFSDFSKEEISRAHPPRVLRTLYLGIDTRRFAPATVKENIVLTVGQVSDGNVKRKGFDAFSEAARRLPQFSFIIAGKRLDDSFDRLKSTAPPNLQLTGYIPDGELANLYSKCKVYVQASAHEGFCVALAEAMSSGCIPVVTDRGALPEVAGEVGMKFPYGDVDLLAEGINRAMEMPASEGAMARERVIRKFDLGRREEGLRTAIGQLLESG
jgi:glycosyltransferase involved in cell wall biosynthesis